MSQRNTQVLIPARAISFSFVIASSSRLSNIEDNPKSIQQRWIVPLILDDEQEAEEDDDDDDEVERRIKEGTNRIDCVNDDLDDYDDVEVVLE